MPADGGLLARWRALVEHGEPDLFEGALLVSRLVDPAEDLDAARNRVAELAALVGAGEEAPLEALRRVLFVEEGFRGDEESYDEPSNSSVARVLARRRGMPITLSIVAIEVGRRAGLDLAGIGLPGHFVVGGPALGGLYLDPFDGGTLGEPEALSVRLAAIFGAPVALGDDALRPDPPRRILARVLLNLRRSYERRHRWEEALAALELSEALDPAEGSALRERGLLLLKVGRNADAVEALERYAAAASPEDAAPVARLVATLRGEGGGADADSGEASEPAPRRVFSLAEARALLPRVQDVTADAVTRYGRLPGEEERREVAEAWARELTSLGLEIKGLWLVDFDSGAGYYCWKYPEAALSHFHAYEEGFAGRVPLQ
ncbi:MAG TPA: tetratricopeptide repeat protein [Thermoanaerobaculia bacterium]|nr:tetratricopeptide repeat protein [Thermoanaerobaculia bacterium]